MKNDMDKISYVLGQSIGGDFRRQSFDIDPDIFGESFKDAFNGKESRMSVGEMQQVIQQFQTSMQEKQHSANHAVAGVNREKGLAFLGENKKKEGVVETDSGLQYRVITQGTGNKPAATDTVETHYEGKTIDGEVFDSSYKRGATATFPLNGVIKGWTEALQLMPEGSKYELFIPSELAYGESGSGGAIEPNSTLIFIVELITIK
ncbi:MAG: FKBP-type peptidyl-prolyl cis-trans isomerase [Proteobacteria bacterium]|nr:FKBP-type peptidyl-prolyl cis-trans isomerase [Pseudomonadota bacterium]